MWCSDCYGYWDRIMLILIIVVVLIVDCIDGNGDMGISFWFKIKEGKIMKRNWEFIFLLYYMYIDFVFYEKM